jgi:putative transposase
MSRSALTSDAAAGAGGTCLPIGASPFQHRTKLHSTNPLERLNKEVKRRADVVGIFPNEVSITRLIGAVLLEQNDEGQLQCRYMQVEARAELTPLLINADPARFPSMAT